jgi:Flp pilus assembly protein TadD
MLLPIATVRLTAKPVDDVAANRAAPAPAARSSSDEPVAIAISIDEAAPVIRAQLRNTDSRYAMQRDTKVELVNKRSKEYESEGEKWYADAYELHRSDRYDDAIAAFMKAIEHGYRVGTSMYNIGCGYAMKGDAENAVRWIDDAFDNGFTKITTVEKDSDLDPIRSDPRFRGLLRDLRARYGTSGRTDRFDAALDRFAGLRASGSQDAGEWADAGLDLLRLRQLDDAIVALEEAVRLAPDRSIAHYNLACAFALEGDHAHALDALERSILAGFDYGNKMSNDPDLESIRGEGRFAALRATNDDLSLWAGMKKRDGQNGRKWDQDTAFREDLPRFEAAAAKYPDAGRAWFNLGYATLRAGSIDRARVAFNRSLDLGFKRATSMYNLACVEAIAGNRDAAFDWLHESEKAGGRFDGMHHDEDLDNIRDDPRFEELLDRMSERNHLDKLRKIEEKAKQKLKDAGWL